MKKKSILKYFVVGAFTLAIIGCQTDPVDENSIDNFSIEDLTEVAAFNGTNSTPIEGQYIVVLNNGTFGKMSGKGISNYKQTQQLLKLETIQKFAKANLKEEDIKGTYGFALEGFTATLNKSQLAELKDDNRVKSIEQDLTISISPYRGKPGGGGGGTPDPQSIPYGTTRVNGGVNTAGSLNTAWVIDSGIDLDHPDLNVDVTRSISFLRKDNPNDENGHGTHVAGTIAAIDNEIGSLGVSPGSTVVAVRVLDRRGSGSISGVIAGIDYVAANGSNGDVANMSLGGGVSTTLDQAVVTAAAGGVKFVLAAGNESDDADNHSPARAEGANIYTISAMNSSDNWASFSNYGSHVDYCAPGVSVFSTWKDGGYNTISGTSMAAPHAAGVLLLGNARTDGTVNGDPDGNPDSIIVH